VTDHYISSTALMSDGCVYQHNNVSHQLPVLCCIFFSSNRYFPSCIFSWSNLPMILLSS